MRKKISLFLLLTMIMMPSGYAMNSSEGEEKSPPLVGDLPQGAEVGHSEEQNAIDDTDYDSDSDFVDFSDDSSSDDDLMLPLPPRKIDCINPDYSDLKDLVFPRSSHCELPVLGEDSDHEEDTKPNDTEGVSLQLNRLELLDLVLPSQSNTDPGGVRCDSKSSCEDRPRPPHVENRGVWVADALMYSCEFRDEIRKANTRLSSCRGVVDVIGVTAIVGDLHGDLKTLKEIIKYLYPLLDSNELNNVVFLGDIMDRGNNSALTLLELLKFFNRYQGRIHIIRGNHETQDMFERHDEQSMPARNDPYFEWVDKGKLYQFFDNLPYAAIINGTTLAVHGGVPRREHWEIFRSRDKCPEGSKDFDSCIHEALWADYADYFDFDSSCSSPRVEYSKLRGGDTLGYNEAAAKEFLESMRLKYMIRGHQPDLGSFHQSPNKTITTVFSALENQGPISNGQGAKTALIVGDKVPQEFATFFAF